MRTLAATLAAVVALGPLVPVGYCYLTSPTTGVCSAIPRTTR